MFLNSKVFQMEYSRDQLGSFGIYKITNRVNGKFYIGSTIHSFRSRWNTHLTTLRNHKHRNTHLQNAFDLYGEESFVFEIVEMCDDKDQVLDREQFHLDSNPSEKLYNIAKSAYAPMTGLHGTGMSGELNSNYGKTHTPEARRKISETHKGKTISEEHKKAISEGNKGKVLSQETKDKMAASKIGNKYWLGRKHSEETKLKIKNALLKRRAKGKDCINND